MSAKTKDKRRKRKVLRIIKVIVEGQSEINSD